jgi:DNA polymerase/3'-5' exonuclease PolX
MEYLAALKIAEEIKSQMDPFYERIEIAGSIRRQREFCNDIEIVAIRKSAYLLELSDLIGQWKKIKGDVSGKYTARLHPTGMQIDIFFATPENWGAILAIRTGSAKFSKRLAKTWVSRGYHSRGGVLYGSHISCEGHELSDPVYIREEKDLFDLLKITWVEPELRF